ncbi:MAG: hypothetical protein GY696_33195 [Gammaproteobacteria bacterium]|nr:hypothetical protein [Gammaproteobacteria bacterium]
MGSRIRLYEPGFVYSAVSGTVDRTFLLKPDHLPDNRLVSGYYLPDFLSPGEKLVPLPSIINAIGAGIGRSLKDNPINIHWFEGNINHMHSGFSGCENTVGKIPDFYRDTNSKIARFVNHTWDRFGHVLNSPYRSEPSTDDMSAEQQLIYAVTNPVKDGLVENASHSPFFSTYRHLAYGEELKFWYIDWETYWKKGGSRRKTHHPNDYIENIKWAVTPLPTWEKLTVHQRQTRFRKLVKEEEEHQKEVRKQENRSVIGVPALFKVDPRDRPKTPRVRSKQPLCHGSDSNKREAYRIKWLIFLDDYRKASWDFRNRDWTRIFPTGSFRPPVIRIIAEDGT